jgi:hypothetical protein
LKQWCKLHHEFNGSAFSWVTSNGCPDEFIGPTHMIFVSMFILFILIKAGLIGDQLAA